MYTFEKVPQSVHFRENVLIDTFSRNKYKVHKFQHANVSFRECVLIGSLFLKCINWYTFPKTAKISLIHVMVLLDTILTYVG